MNALRFASLVLIALAASPSWADEVKTITGKSLNGSLEKITDAEIVLNVGGKSVSTPMPQVLDVELRPARSAPSAAKYSEVHLLDESILYCTKVAYGAKDAQLELTNGAAVKVPFAAFAAVLRDGHEPALKKQWVTLLNERRRKDRIFVLKDGNLAALEGIFGAIDEKAQTIQFKSDVGKEISASLANIQAMQFVPTNIQAEVALCKVVDVDGNLIVASKVGYAGAQIALTTSFGQKVSLDVKAVARIDFNFGRLTYLSDLDAKMAEVTFLGGFNPVRKDTNLDGYPIMLQDKKYDKGLSMYAGVELEYNLGGKYKDFKALLGVDSRIAEEGQGKVTLVVYCDNERRGVFEVSTKAPTPLSISVKDAQTLRIIVSGSKITNLGGHAMLANAHVSQ
ncbi:MAG: NPCBM/NEW2 domain-containing protein [Planctomycetes bacterium]|nr:NPCBM/NEW2 domain-containing protein [Planctomycetota bacterium]